MLVQLKLQNFKKHADLTVNFAPGLNVIVGPNYRGKSSILHGLLYAFWGATAVPCNADKIPRAGTTTFKVELDFRIGDDLWQVKRTKSTDNLLKNGEPQASGKAPVAARIQQLLGMSQAQFLRLLYAEQKRAESLVALGAADLNKTIEEVAGTTTVRDAIAKLTNIIRETSAAADAVRGVIGAAPDKEQVPALEASVRTLAGEKDAEETRYQACVATRDDARAAAERARMRQQQYVQLQGRLHTDESQLARAQQQLADLPLASPERLDELQVAVEDANARLADLRAERATVKAGVDAWDAHQRALATLIADEARLPALAPLPDAVDAAALAQAEQDVIDAAEDATTDRNKVRDLKAAAAGGVCATCKRPFDDHDPAAIAAELAQAEALLVTSSRVHGEMVAHRDALKQAAAARQRAEEANARAQAALDAYAARKAAFEAQPVPAGSPERLAEIDSQGGKVKAGLDAMVAEQTQLMGRQRARDEAQAQVTRAADAVARSREQLEALDFEPEEIDGAVKAAATATDMVNAAAADLESARQRYQAAAFELRTLQGQVAQYEQAKVKLEAHELRGGRAKKLREFLQANFDSFMQDTWEGLLAMASHFTRLGTEGHISEVIRSDDGKFEYIEEGEKFSVMGSASGAQRSLMGLSMQIAMSEMLPCPLRCLLMDEASADMDAEVSGALTTVLRNLGKQVILVSHRELDAAVADNVIALE